MSGNDTSGTGVSGKSVTNGVGVAGVSSGNNAVQGFAHSTGGSGVAGFNDAKDATGVYGNAPNGYGFVTGSHVSQGRSMGGWLKAMAYINPNSSGIMRCFNSQLNGSAATTVPCGMTYTYVNTAEYLVDFGFQVDDRFLSVTPAGYAGANNTLFACLDDQCGSGVVSPNQVLINGGSSFDVPFFVSVF